MRKALMKEIKANLSKWRDIPYTSIGRLNIPIKIPASYLVDIDTKVYKVRQNTQKDQHNIE